MDFSGIVQNVSRQGEITYISSTPNYNPIQAIPPVRGGQESFSGYNQNPYLSSGYKKYSSERQGNLANNYRDLAQEIGQKVKSGRETITPGMLLDIVA